MTLRGSVLSARVVGGTRVAVPMLLAAVALSACSDDQPTASPTTSTGTSQSPTGTPSATSPTPSATPSVTVTTTPSVTPTPTSSPSKTTTAPIPTPTSTQVDCSASRAGSANVTGMSAAAAAKAKKVLAAAKACDASALIALAKADSTGLAGEKPATAVFTAGTPQNFVALATLLTMEPTETFDGTIQPKVFSERYAEDDAEWNKVIAAGLVTRAGASTMRTTDGGYTGYRVGIAGDGTWTFFTSGR